jgi:hypothetical protein
MRGRAGTAAVLLVGCMALAGCTSTVSGHGTSTLAGSAAGPSGFPSAGGSTPRGAPPGSGTSSGAPSAAALARIVVQRSDLPAGWTGKPAAGQGNTDTDLQSRLLSCIGGHIDRSQQVAQVTGDDFTQGEMTISSDATSFKSRAEVDNRSAILTAPKAGTCLNQIVRQLLQDQLPAGTQLNGVAISLTGGSNGGPPNLVATEKGKITVSTAGQTVTVYLDAAFLRGNQVTASVEFEGIGQPVDANLQASVIAAVAARAARS